MGALSLAGRTVLVTGGSRGIGLAIAKRCAADGANIVIGAKTADPHPKLPGTIYTAAKECEQAGGRALAVQVDVMDDEANQRFIDAAMSEFGRIDVLINNASAIDNSGTLDIKPKKYALMHNINGRGTFWTTKLALPHLLESDNPHVLNLSPPLVTDPRWMKLGGVAYSMAKFNMTMCAVGMAEEFKGRVAFNTLWPKTTIATAAMQMLGGEAGMKACRTVDIMSDAAHWILTQPHAEVTGNTFIDEDIVTERLGASDEKLAQYRVSRIVPPMQDLYVGDPVAFEKVVAKVQMVQGLAKAAGSFTKLWK